METNDYLKDLKEGKVPLERLAISTQITKPLDEYDIVSPETAAARKLASFTPLTIFFHFQSCS